MEFIRLRESNNYSQNDYLVDIVLASKELDRFKPRAYICIVPKVKDVVLISVEKEIKNHNHHYFLGTSFADTNIKDFYDRLFHYFDAQYPELYKKLVDYFNLTFECSYPEYFHNA